MEKTYYKYAERQAEQQIDWSVVGKTISDTLMDVNKVREEKKAEIDDNTRKYMKYVQESPQGQFQDGNKFTNEFAHSMMEQQLIDSKLLKSGQMKLQDYTLRRQNYKDGTETLFSLSKMYQDVYKQRMDNLMSGKSQAINGANMALVEGFADFSKSKAFINPTSGEVNIGMMKMNEKTGQLEIDKNSMVPVNVLKGKIQAEIPTFDVEGEMNKTVKGLGNVIRTIYDKADRRTYGTIEKLTGILSLVGAKTKIPDEFKPEIDQFNKAIDQTINGYFADDYHITSVLTQNIGGKYSQESFTYNRDEADADPSKILLKINPNTGLGTIDKSAKNFNAQEAEARDWVKTQITSKLTNEREKVTTSTVPYGPQESSGSIEARGKLNQTISDAQDIGALWGGDAAQIRAAVQSLANMNPKIKGAKRTRQGFELQVDVDGKIEPRTLSFYAKDGSRLTQEQFIRSASSLLLGNADINTAIQKGGLLKGANFNNLDEEEYVIEIPKEAAEPVSVVIPNSIFTMRSQKATPSLQKLLPAGFTVVDAGGMTGNTVQVYAPGKSAANNDAPFEFSAKSTPTEMAQSKADLEEFIKANSKVGTTPAAAKGGGTLPGGKVRE
jgi:hypothetical protein